MIQDIGIFDTITADYIVASAKMDLDLTSTTTQDVYLLNKVNEAIGALRNCFTLIPVPAIIPISYSNGLGIAQTPKGYSKLLELSLADTLEEAQNERQNNNPITGVTITDGFIYFSSNVTQPYCKLIYLSTNTDETGELKIPALALRPIKAYVCAEWLFKAEDKRWARWDDRWRKGKAWLRGIMAEPSKIEAEQLGYINNHMAQYNSELYWNY